MLSAATSILTHASSMAQARTTTPSCSTQQTSNREHEGKVQSVFLYLIAKDKTPDTLIVLNSTQEWILDYIQLLNSPGGVYGGYPQFAKLTGSGPGILSARRAFPATLHKRRISFYSELASELDQQQRDNCGDSADIQDSQSIKERKQKIDGNAGEVWSKRTENDNNVDNDNEEDGPSSLPSA